MKDKIRDKIDGLRSEKWWIRLMTARDLADCSSAPKEAVYNLTSLLQDKRGEIRQATNRALVKMGSPAVVPLCRMYKWLKIRSLAFPHETWAGERDLSFETPLKVPFFIHLQALSLRRNQKPLCLSPDLVLLEMARENKEAGPALVDGALALLAEPDQSSKNLALQIFSLVSDGALKSHPQLVFSLTPFLDPNHKKFPQVLNLLQRMGPLSAPLSKTFISLLTRASPKFLPALLNIIKNITPPASSVTPVLKELYEKYLGTLESTDGLKTRKIGYHHSQRSPSNRNLLHLIKETIFLLEDIRPGRCLPSPDCSNLTPVSSKSTSSAADLPLFTSYSEVKAYFINLIDILVDTRKETAYKGDAPFCDYPLAGLNLTLFEEVVKDCRLCLQGAWEGITKALEKTDFDRWQIGFRILWEMEGEKKDQAFQFLIKTMSRGTKRQKYFLSLFLLDYFKDKKSQHIDSLANLGEMVWTLEEIFQSEKDGTFQKYLACILYELGPYSFRRFLR